MARVVILGGGFGGLAAAQELRSTLPSGDEIVVVSASDRFFMGFAKLWDLAGLRPLEQGTRWLTALADHGIRFVHAEVNAIEPGSLAVSTTSGELAGDALLVAMGTVPVPEHLQLIADGEGHNLYDARALPAMGAELDAVTSGRVVVAILGGPFKCPPAPYEAALIVDERLRRRAVRDKVAVAIVTPQPMTLPAAGPDASQVLAGHLADRDISVLERRVVSGVDGDRHVLWVDREEMERFEYSVLLGVPAEKAPPVIEASPLAGASGFIEPDRFTLRTSSRGVYAVGDCTTVPTAAAPLPKAGVLAASQGRVAARNIATDLYGGKEAAFDGHGVCFLELPGRRVAMLEGRFFAEPRPDVRLTEATEENFELKQAYERDRLGEWLG